MPLVFGRSILGFAAVAVDPGVTWTNPDLANTSYDSVSFSISSQDGSPVELTFNDDGSKMYVMGLFSRTIYQYSLSTEYDVSTASYDSVSFSVASQLSLAGGFVFNNNGTKLYATGEGGDAVFQYSLSTAYNVGTASYDSVTLDVSSQEGGANAIEFSTDGTKLYIIGWQNDTVFQYTLTSAFDLSTASYANKSFSVASQESNPFGLRFNPDGTKMYITGTSSDSVRQYTLSTAFDVSTASYDSVLFSVSSQETTPHAMAFKNNGSKLYILGQTSDTVFQYSTVAAAWTNPDIANASYDSVSASVSSQASQPHSLVFKDDGTTAYLLDAGSDAVYEYDLSTAWDLSTLSYSSASLSISSQEGYPSQIYFKPDGTKIYLIGFAANSVFQYGLTTAWDLSTASYDSVSFSVSSQTTAANGLAFKPDGTKFYVCDFTGAADKVYQYSLSTAWDLSTASYVSNSGNLTEEGIAAEIIFNPDGTKLWLGGPSQDKVFQYSLSTAWDITTVNYDSVSFSVSSQESNFRGFNFKADGSKLYAVGWTNDTIYQYST